MIYDTLLARSFSRHEQKKLGYGALVVCLLIAMSFCTVFKPNLVNMQLSIGVAHKMLMVNDTSSPQQIVRDTETIADEMLMENVTVTSSPRQIFKDAENLMKNMLKFNDTISSQQIFIHDTSNSKQMAMNDTGSSQQTFINDSKSNSKQKDMNDTSGSSQQTVIVEEKETCNTKERLSDFCEGSGDIRIDGKSASVLIVSPQANVPPAKNSSWSIRPYARKIDENAMTMVREWSVKSLTGSQGIPQCTKHHNVPAIIFSLGGYSGNHFHAFTDIIVPLYITSRPFNGEVKFLFTNKLPFWVDKFQTILQKLSRYDFIDIDKEEEIHCFPSITVGLQKHKELGIDPSKSPNSMNDFMQFLRNSYSLAKSTAITIRDDEQRRPRLLILSRKRTRSITNEGEISTMAASLGFEVVVAEADKNVSRFAHIMNSCDVVMGVHGAGLTNMVFLPEKAVLIQVVPFGRVDVHAKVCFEEPAKDMNIRYMDYKIKLKESSLIQQYPSDHVVLKNPSVIARQGWVPFASVYLDKQNVKLDLKRFRPTLLKALKLLHK